MAGCYCNPSHKELLFLLLIFITVMFIALTFYFKNKCLKLFISLDSKYNAVWCKNQLHCGWRQKQRITTSCHVFYNKTYRRKSSFHNKRDGIQRVFLKALVSVPPIPAEELTETAATASTV